MGHRHQELRTEMEDRHRGVLRDPPVLTLTWAVIQEEEREQGRETVLEEEIFRVPRGQRGEGSSSGARVPVQEPDTLEGAEEGGDDGGEDNGTCRCR